ncbi:MAG: putative toxin-antitoxin system toxin component, PIN family [Actinobacteria bacterium]|nr:putative toxin-antitoxin system toxin component, PIN family [Actinomycetota bacterium]
MSGAAKDKMPRVFLDTNVFFSAFHTPDSPPGSILRMVLERKIETVISKQVLEELIRTLKAKLPEALPSLRVFLLNSPLEITGDPAAGEARKWEQDLEAGDASILAASISAEIEFLVTGDRHFLQNRELLSNSGITIIAPAEFIKQMK